MWFTENAWQPILLFGILAMLSALTWFRQRRSLFLTCSAVCLVAIGATWFVERAIVTDRERVTDAVVGITHAFQQQDLERTTSYVSARNDDLKALINVFIYQVIIKDMRLTDIQVELTSGNTRAVCRFRVNANFQMGDIATREPTRWETRWQLEANEWKMIDVIRLNPLTGDVMYHDEEVRRYLFE